MTRKSPNYQIIPFPKIRRLMVDGGRLARQKHIVHGLVEMDVTCARQAIMQEFGVHSTVELVRKAAHAGLIAIDSPP